MSYDKHSYYATKLLQKDALADKIRVIRDSRLFCDLDGAAIRSFIEQSYIFSCPKGENILKQGQPVEHYYMILAGRMKIFNESGSGKKFIIDIYHAGEPFYLAPLFSGNPSSASSKAMEDSLILRMEKTIFFDFLLNHSLSALRFIEMFSSRSIYMILRTRDCLIDKANDRLLFTLQLLNRRFGNSLKFTLFEIAELSSTTTETAIRFMHMLKKEGLASVTRGKISIEDNRKLQEFILT